MLAETGGLDTTGIDILGGSTSHVDVSLPAQRDDEEYADDEVVDDGYVLAELAGAADDGAHEVVHGDVEADEPERRRGGRRPGRARSTTTSRESRTRTSTRPTS